MSGGIDSAVALYMAKEEHNYTLINPIFFNRRWEGKGHNSLEMERIAIQKQLDTLGIESKICEIEIPFSWREKAQEKTEEKISPFGRNLIFLSIATAYATTKAKLDNYSFEPDLIVGFIKNEVADCSPSFVKAIENAANESIERPTTEFAIRIVTPLIGMSKPEVIRYAIDQGVENLLANSWSCYYGGDRHCGKCGSCEERKGAFKIAKIGDPAD